MGIPIFKPYEDLTPIELKSNKWKVQAFDCTDLQGNFKHTNADGSECKIYGFLIYHKEMERPLLYATDTCFIKYRFNNLGNIILGVDYQEEMLDMDSAKTFHQITGHMSIDTACEFVKVNDNDYLQNVILGHLSGSNADVDYFIERMEEITLKPITIAHKGMEINLSDIPF